MLETGRAEVIRRGVRLNSGKVGHVLASWNPKILGLLARNRHKRQQATSYHYSPLSSPSENELQTPQNLARVKG